ncbi:TetR/AcrR family transcriptional regulator [Mycobacterium manitobense]|uniref:TetR/AcrR family transcriptional regulator n=1 Tax=[Mycobacterium] manitobense TaxID=190147 RepID=A0A9X2YN36_9MYCO|nr:TetR/AcrR family transcriptional regulator [[Mycobacterium] manitobense]MCV7169587.1 TetR/AcrR family transcriptional regulator [[Mycobacterium] manitobense]
MVKGATTRAARGEPVRRARQARSQETLDRFLDATEELLHHKLFHEIGVMEIIERSGRTVGSFYARFDDKYAVLRLLRERTEERARSTLHAVMRPEAFAEAGAEQIIGTVVRTMLATYRDLGPVYRATAAQACVDEEFRAHRQEMFRMVAARYAELLLVHRDRIGAPDPERAVDLGFALMVGLLDQRLLFGPLGVTDVGEDALADEMAAVAVGLLDLR